MPYPGTKRLGSHSPLILSDKNFEEEMVKYWFLDAHIISNQNKKATPNSSLISASLWSGAHGHSYFPRLLILCCLGLGVYVY